MNINRSGEHTNVSALVVGAGVGLLAGIALGRRRAILGRATRLEL